MGKGKVLHRLNTVLDGQNMPCYTFQIHTQHFYNGLLEQLEWCETRLYGGDARKTFCTTKLRFCAALDARNWL